MRIGVFWIGLPRIASHLGVSSRILKHIMDDQRGKTTRAISDRLPPLWRYNVIVTKDLSFRQFGIVSVTTKKTSFPDLMFPAS